MKKISEKTTDIVLAMLVVGHALFIFINAFFHQQIDPLYSMHDERFVLLLTMLLPMAAAAILSSKGRRYGIILLLGLTPAFLIGSLFNRFFPVLPAGKLMASFGPKFIFEVSYWLILFAESAMFVFALKLFKTFHATRES
jgi:hypothetical protein